EGRRRLRASRGMRAPPRHESRWILDITSLTMARGKDSRRTEVVSIKKNACLRLGRVRTLCRLFQGALSGLGEGVSEHALGGANQVWPPGWRAAHLRAAPLSNDATKSA